MSEEKHLDDHRNDATGNDKTAISDAKNPSAKDHALLARMVIREGKSFYESALAAGYCDSIARRGLHALAIQSKPLSDALKHESDALQVRTDKLKPLALNRLYYEIADIDNGSDGLRAIEIAGRFKETDWFVRSSELNLGMFVSIADETIDNSPDKLKE